MSRLLPFSGRPLRFLLAGLIVAGAGLFVLACGDSDDGAPAPAATPTTPATSGSANTSGGSCTGPAVSKIERNNRRNFAAPPPMLIDPARTYTATLDTTRGKVTLELYPVEAPVTVNNFVFLSCTGYYDGLTFHRVINSPPFMIQGGDPRANGTGGPGYTFKDEFAPNRKHDGAGVLSMANAGPNTNGSQFFITLSAQPHLDGKHSVFGKVTSGQDVVSAVRQGDTITAISITEQ